MGDKNKWSLAIGTLTAVATLGAWLLPGGIRPLSSEKATLHEPIGMEGNALAEPEAKHQAQLPDIPVQGDEPSLRLSPPASSGDGDTTRASHDWKAQTFTLLDQEQRTLVPGCASLAVEFQEVAGEDFTTVRINVGEESTNHAVAQAGEQFRFACGDRDYRLSILLVDRNTGTVRVGVEKINS